MAQGARDKPEPGLSFILIPNDSIHKLSYVAESHGKTVAQVIAEAISHYIKHLNETRG